MKKDSLRCRAFCVLKLMLLALTSLQLQALPQQAAIVGQQEQQSAGTAAQAQQNQQLPQVQNSPQPEPSPPAQDLPAIASADAPCTLVAHLNESRADTEAEGLQLPRWYDLHARLLHLLTDEAGCQLTVVGSPWPRSLALLQQGKIDLMLTMSYTKERAGYADFIGVHYMEESVLVLHKNYLHLVHQLSDINLLPGSIGVLRDAYYGDAFEQLRHEKSYQPFLQYASSLTQKLNMLKKGRVLGMIEDKTQYLEWSQLYPELRAQYRLSLSLHKAPVYIVASKAGVSPELRLRLHQAWQRVYGQEKHRAILAEFGWTLE
ncbi:substrate-binding periplasmic protein [Rheinheimera sp. 4Y26]|uniref:substrate-binding periplasmic protein n=1 Tax=Rheinheimera sp. 4Y26 TaxID=2977811 RepID=UPI0021B12D6F|nr:transporter substrate-binding domain-containing protein [Rheinheimera sp. 4Y26]MCT6699813.1 transporter substrate-binding domain-containing protein [Rheinheimera sp. 4Y26]